MRNSGTVKTLPHFESILQLWMRFFPGRKVLKSSTCGLFVSKHKGWYRCKACPFHSLLGCWDTQNAFCCVTRTWRNDSKILCFQISFRWLEHSWSHVWQGISARVPTLPNQVQVRVQGPGAKILPTFVQFKVHKHDGSLRRSVRRRLGNLKFLGLPHRCVPRWRQWKDVR